MSSPAEDNAASPPRLSLWRAIVWGAAVAWFLFASCFFLWSMVFFVQAGL